jgi:hypothetical protein
MMVKAFQEQQILKKKNSFYFSAFVFFNKPITINDIKKICIPEPINAARTFLRRGGRKTSPCTLKNKYRLF